MAISNQQTHRKVQIVNKHDVLFPIMNPRIDFIQISKCLTTKWAKKCYVETGVGVAS